MVRGVIADLELHTNEPETERLAVRADIDALRIQDEKSVDYSSRVPQHDARLRDMMRTLRFWLRRCL